ncbi:GDSL-type esterase/lipase family protein [Cyclobacterium marinum]|uniref:Lipolytic protein G-D-S-L family n=1 Tax=Cyclobacterium marinum (strain ATCC 25205 / DSM 745 / LMG 13164 / NCIMB 1802) TaxID=880070 RepID=G0J893_CYCMS|nr:GDSL-type esterase/lipase family protein [Cyclobacterium marinum]AEL27873.1 lipolytic protein G-D-S-L family [Cyclobacterium marinum DSM 745]MBI0397649.1 lipase [Cyclobacterium marinum]
MIKPLIYIIPFLILIAYGPSKNKSKHPRNGNEIAECQENPAAIAQKKEDEGWLSRHQKILGRRTPEAQLILVGNSIFHSLDNEDRNQVWEKYLNPFQTINMGISGDRTENVIWRLENGSLEHINPKVAVVLIGTNNTDGNHYLSISTPEELAGGIHKICSLITEKLPETKILLMGILPYGYKPNHRDNLNKTTNRLIAKFPKDNSRIHYMDISDVYYNEDGKVNRELMPDFLHPNPEGHRLMFEALYPKIEELMK